MNVEQVTEDTLKHVIKALEETKCQVAMEDVTFTVAKARITGSLLFTLAALKPFLPEAIQEQVQVIVDFDQDIYETWSAVNVRHITTLPAAGEDVVKKR